jgi:hypothetical protein
MSSSFRATVFYGIVFDGPEREGDCDHREGVAFPLVDDECFAVAAARSMLVVNPEDTDKGPVEIKRPFVWRTKWDEALRAWCKATGRRWRKPRWYFTGGWT